MSKPRIAITMGDPAGVGPEICLRAVANEKLRKRCLPIVFGDAAVLQRCARRLNAEFDSRIIPFAERNRDSFMSAPAILDFHNIPTDSLVPGAVSAATGKASFEYIASAIDEAIAGRVDAVVTGPINKEALRQAGIRFPGHTDIFAQRTKTENYCMLQYSDEITCSFVTTHIGYADVPSHLTTERIVEVIELSHDAVYRMRHVRPQIVVCGLNPHAGEHGLFGNREEERIIQPAIDLATQKGIDVLGPLPPDTAFLPERRRQTGCFVCMYHDQGHIPLKALAFDSAVNVTLGLPIIRTSVDHGTACDIAWQGIANPGSLFRAIELAINLASTKSA